MERPKPLKKPDFVSLVKYVEGSLDTTIKNGREDDDTSHYLYEKLMMVIYGNDFFKWFYQQEFMC